MTLVENPEKELRDLDVKSSLLYRDTDYEKCVEVLRVSYKLRVSLLGSAHNDSVLNLANLGASLGRAGYLKEAEEAFREVLAHRKDKEKEANYLNMATAMMHLGVCLKNQGKFVEAHELLQDSLMNSFRGYNGGIHKLATAEASFAFAVLAVQMGRICKAYILFTLAERCLIKVLGEDHLHTRDTIWWTKRSFELMTDEGKHPVLDEVTGLIQQISAAEEIQPFNRNQIDLMNTFDGIEFDSRTAWKSEPDCDVCGFMYQLTEREHHCRPCARSVCHACSVALVFMGSNKPKKERCCNLCAHAGFA